MSCSNRELVKFFLGYKLSQRNYPESLLMLRIGGEQREGEEVTTASSNGVPQTPSAVLQHCSGAEAVKAALKDSADEFELRFTQAFRNLFLKLDLTPDTVYHSFKSVMDEVFRDGVNWGRIVGLFTFGGVLCVECVQRNMSELVPRIADWMTMYLDEYIDPWIQSQGGWVSVQEPHTLWPLYTWHSMISTIKKYSCSCVICVWIPPPPPPSSVDI